MSRVTNVMLSVTSKDRANAEEFSKWLKEDCPRVDPRDKATGCGDLALITDPETHNWGGYKHPECDVYAGTLNHARVGSVIDRFGRVPWRVPSAVQLFVMDQEEFFFRVWMIRDGAPRQYAPTSPIEEDDAFWPSEETESTEQKRARMARRIAEEATAGGEIDGILAEFRTHNADIIDVIFAVRTGLGVDVGAAKQVVVTSVAWRDYADAQRQYLEWAEKTVLRDAD
ncbi:hypothetical protein [Micromonospora sp. CPCC 206061]|uniref:hypothetical protein n=1 Tax=Micromonospora sp. CPCC 206061 TaxID=3122410 RepID=UPI002FF39ED9